MNVPLEHLRVSREYGQILLVWGSENILKQHPWSLSLGARAMVTVKTAPIISKHPHHSISPGSRRNVDPGPVDGARIWSSSPVMMSVRFYRVWNPAGCLGRICKSGCMIFFCYEHCFKIPLGKEWGMVLATVQPVGAFS